MLGEAYNTNARILNKADGDPIRQRSLGEIMSFFNIPAPEISGGSYKLKKQELPIKEFLRL